MQPWCSKCHANCNCGIVVVPSGYGTLHPPHPSLPLTCGCVSGLQTALVPPYPASPGLPPRGGAHDAHSHHPRCSRRSRSCSSPGTPSPPSRYGPPSSPRQRSCRRSSALPPPAPGPPPPCRRSPRRTSPPTAGAVCRLGLVSPSSVSSAALMHVSHAYLAERPHSNTRSLVPFINFTGLRLILFCTCPPLCVGALWPMPAWVWRDVRSVFFP